MLLGCAIVVLCGAGIGAAFVLGQLSALQDALGQNPSLLVGTGVLAPSGYGDPETLLLVGNDQRNHTTTAPVLPHSNEMLLVRIDPGRPYISMMSIPRELEVRITPTGQAPITTRLNYAYTAGGIPLLVSTIRRVTGLSVNHVVVIDFNQFKRAVDDLGCVYSTIDRRYYHVNTPTSEQYQEINLQAGYQRLCGALALQFVSYRHGDTSLVRDARDQSFLLDVKRQYGSTLVGNVGKFERIFGATVQTDPGLKSATGLLNLIGTLINSASLRVRQVHFSVNLVAPGATPCSCVTAGPQQIAASVDSFLHGRLSRPASAATARAARRRRSTAGLPLTATGAAELARARSAASRLPVTYEYPRVQDASGATIPVTLRDYFIRGPDHALHPSYVAVFSAGQLGQYYDVQGTTWQHAPLLDNPDATVAAAGRRYRLYYSGQHLNVVGWTDRGVVYWVRNSLTDALSNGEMLAIAQQTRPVDAANRAAASAVRLRLSHIRLPSHSGAQAGSGANAGAVAALLTLIGLVLPAGGLIRRRRELRGLRDQLSANAARHARVSATLAGERGPRSQ